MTKAIKVIDLFILDKVNPHGSIYKDIFDLKKYENSLLQKKLKCNMIEFKFIINNFL